MNVERALLLLVSEATIEARSLQLVRSVSGRPALGYGMHRPGPDLNLATRTLVAAQAEMDRSIPVRFGRGDIVADSMTARRPGLTDEVEDVVAAREVIDEHPESETIVDLVPLEVVSFHFFPEGRRALDSPLVGGLHTGSPDEPLDGHLRLGERG
jgi:hypothetical protein